MLICGENVHSCCVQRRAQTHVKRFHTFACDAVGLQCWVNADIREAVLAHERFTKGSSSESILKQIQTSSEQDTSAPMEVERICNGGKDKGKGGKKGDPKRRGGGAFGGMPWRFGRCKGKGKQKGKSKGKKGSGKKGGGKSKGK